MGFWSKTNRIFVLIEALDNFETFIIRNEDTTMTILLSYFTICMNKPASIIRINLLFTTLHQENIE